MLRGSQFAVQVIQVSTLGPADILGLRLGENPLLALTIWLQLRDYVGGGELTLPSLHGFRSFQKVCIWVRSTLFRGMDTSPMGSLRLKRS